MECPAQHIHKNDMWFSYQSDSRISIFYGSDPNSDSTRADSDSDSDSRVYQNPWFWFQFRFPWRVILLLIPIPVFPKNLIPILILIYVSYSIVLVIGPAKPFIVGMCFQAVQHGRKKISPKFFHDPGHLQSKILGCKDHSGGGC